MLVPLVSVHILLTTRLTADPSPTPSPTASPSPTPSLGGVADSLLAPFSSAITPTSKIDCNPDDVSVCGLVVKVTGNKTLGQILDVVLGTPLRLLLIIILGVLVRRALHRLIHRLAERIATGPAGGEPRAQRRPGSRRGRIPGRRTGTLETVPVIGPVAPASPLLATRRQARARTLASVLRSVTTALIAVVVTLMVLQELDFSVGPLLASAGVVGVALGLGAQSLVRDIVAGIFMIVEDQYGVGDVVDVGPASGSVEAVGLRVTRLRDVNGTVWYVRNGEIMRVGNQSQGWSRAVLDISIGYGEEIDRVEAVLLDTAQGLRADPQFSPLILDDPEVWGVEELTSDGVVIRLVARTQPMQQWVVARELRRRIKQQFDAEGIEMRTVPTTVVINGDDAPDPHHADDADALEQ
jgi:moderate conductance mechanosensitive channel